MSYLYNYGPPAPRQLAPRTHGEHLPGAACPCWRRRQRAAASHRAGGSLHAGSHTAIRMAGRGCLCPLDFSNRGGSQQHAAITSGSPLASHWKHIRNNEICPGSVHGTLWQGISLHVQGCVSSYTGSETRGEGFWMVVFLEAGFSQRCYRIRRVVQTPPSLVQTLRWDQNSKN